MDPDCSRIVQTLLKGATIAQLPQTLDQPPPSRRRPSRPLRRPSPFTPVSAASPDEVLAYLSAVGSGDRVVVLVTNPFGSHVVEDLLRVLGEKELLPVLFASSRRSSSAAACAPGSHAAAHWPPRRSACAQRLVPACSPLGSHLQALRCP